MFFYHNFKLIVSLANVNHNIDYFYIIYSNLVTNKFGGKSNPKVEYRVS
jgi:hypothetical protein